MAEVADGGHRGGVDVAGAFFLFGYLALGSALGDLTWQIVVYGALSLTLVRMLPAALSLQGLGFGPRTLAFVGWCGPRGPSMVLGLTLLADREKVGGTDLIVTVMAVVVGASILLHGVSSRPLSRRYGGSDEAARLREEQPDDQPVVPTRYDSTTEAAAPEP